MRWRNHRALGAGTRPNVVVTLEMQKKGVTAITAIKSRKEEKKSVGLTFEGEGGSVQRGKTTERTPILLSVSLVIVDCSV